jgi:hypothetical protein
MFLKKLLVDYFAGGANLTEGAQKRNEKHLAQLLNDLMEASNLVVLDSAAGAGGAASEAMVVTGLLATDTILSVVQMTKGANNLPLLGFSGLAADELTAVWSADPGAGAVIKVLVKRAVPAA